MKLRVQALHRLRKVLQVADYSGKNACVRRRQVLKLPAMRPQGNRRNRVPPAAMLLVALGCFQANASEIKQLRIETGATGTRAELHLDKAGDYRLIPLSNPERLAVDFPASHLARGLALPAAAGMVKAVRTGQPVPGTVRVVFDLAGKVKAIPTTLDAGASGTESAKVPGFFRNSGMKAEAMKMIDRIRKASAIAITVASRCSNWAISRRA